MKVRWTLIGLLIAAMVLAACGGSPPPPPPPPQPDAEPQVAADEVAPLPLPAAAMINTAESELGTILVDGEGWTLYAYTNDGENQSECSGNCADFWPPLLTDSLPTAGEGVDETLLGTLTRSDGSTQVSYNGMPLYHYSEDANPGDTMGQGFNDFWYVVDADGEMVHPKSDSSGNGSSGGDDLDDLY